MNFVDIKLWLTTQTINNVKKIDMIIYSSPTYIYNISIYYVPVNIIFIFIDVLYFYMHKYLKLYTLNYWHGFHRVIREIKISLFQSIIISYYCFIYQLCFLVMRTNIKQPCIFNIIIKKWIWIKKCNIRVTSNP